MYSVARDPLMQVPKISAPKRRRKTADPVIICEGKCVVICRHEAYFGDALFRAKIVAFTQRLAPIELAAFFHQQKCYIPEGMLVNVKKL